MECSPRKTNQGKEIDQKNAVQRAKIELIRASVKLIVSDFEPPPEPPPWLPVASAEPGAPEDREGEPPGYRSMSKSDDIGRKARTRSNRGVRTVVVRLDISVRHGFVQAADDGLDSEGRVVR